MYCLFVNLLVQGPKITYNSCLSRRGYCGVLRWISFILNSLIHWTSNRDNFIFPTPTFVTWYFCFPRKVCNMIPLFSQKNIQRKLSDMLTFFLLESNEIMLLLTKEKEEEWFCFIQEANFHFIAKQLLVQLSNSLVVSRNSTFIRLPALVLTVNLFKINNDID